MPTTPSHLLFHSTLPLSLSFSISPPPSYPPTHFFFFSSGPLLSSELLLSQSNVCVYLINSEALLITATGRYVAWMVTRWPGQEQCAASELKWNLDRDATLTWHHPANQLVLFFTNPLPSLVPVRVTVANSEADTHTAQVLLWRTHRGSPTTWSSFYTKWLLSVCWMFWSLCDPKQTFHKYCWLIRHFLIHRLCLFIPSLSFSCCCTC